MYGKVWNQAHIKGSVLALKDGTDRLSRNVSNYQSTLRNIPKDRRSYFLMQYTQIGLRIGDVICFTVT
jgi:hypothetical protein